MKRAILLSITLFASIASSGCSYNDLNAKQQNVKGKWSNVESSLQRRADLIPNLVQTAQIARAGAGGFRADSRCPIATDKRTGTAPADANGDKTPEQKQAVIEANNSFGGKIGRLLLAGGLSAAAFE